MDKIIEFFKQKLSLPTTYSEKIGVIKNSINIPTTLSENEKEQLEALLDEYKISIKSTSLSSLQNIGNVLKSFAVKIEENNEDELLEKIELISSITKWHGFNDIEKISQDNLNNLQKLYQELAASNLSEIKYEDFNRIRKIDLLPIKQFTKLSSNDLEQILKFTKSFDITTKISRSRF